MPFQTGIKAGMRKERRVCPVGVQCSVQRSEWVRIDPVFFLMLFPERRNCGIHTTVAEVAPVPMKLLTLRQKPAKPEKRSSVPQTAPEWIEEARLAEEEEQWTRAIVCYRRALALAPFCLQSRRALELALEQQILAEGITVEQLIQKANDLESEDAGIEDALDEDFFDEEEAEMEAIPPPKKPRRRAPRSKAPDNITLPRSIALPSVRRFSLAAAAVLALVLTSALLFGVVSATGYVRSLLADRSFAALTETEELPQPLLDLMAESSQLISAGKAREAADKLRASATEFPEHEELIQTSLVQALRAEGNDALRSRDYQKAADAFQEAADADPSNPHNWIDLGRALRNHARSKSGQPSTMREILADAEEAFRKALTLSPDDSVALFGLAQVFDAKNDRKQAVETYEQLVAVAPKSFEGRMAVTALEQLKRR